MSETGVGDLHDPSAQASRRSLLGLCRLLGGALLTWYRDPRVDVAFQYTFRQDPLFPVGLISPQLSQIYPSYYLLRAWATRGSPSAPPPPLPRQCLG